MAQKIIPLNRFRSIFKSGIKSDGLYELYSVPSQRSATVIMAQCANTTNETRTVTFGVSSVSSSFHHLVKNFEIPANDARNLLSGRLILQGVDGDTVLFPEILFIKDMTPLNNSEIILVNGFNNFIVVIDNYENVPQTTPAGTITDNSYLNASILISRYSLDLRLETVKYFKTLSNALSTETLSANFSRDVGYIVDSISADIKNNANHRSIETGVAYFSGYIDSSTGTNKYSDFIVPNGEVQATITAISAIGAFISGIDMPVSTTIFENGILSAGSVTDRRQDVINLTNTVYHPLSTGGDRFLYSPSGSPTNADIEFANSISQNKLKIQKIVKDYVFNKEYLTDAVNIAKCNRDVGLMIDSVINDLTTGVIARSIQYAVFYWDGSISRIPNSNLIINQKEKTLDTVEFLKRTTLNINAPLSGGLTISLGFLESKY